MYTAPHGDGSTLKPLSGPVLLAYARYLGLDPETEPELLHIAREALTDSLPLGWERHLDATHNMPFFYCHNGGFTSWQHPQLSHYLTKIDMLRRPAARPQHKPRQSQYSPRQPPPHTAAPQQYRQQAAAVAGGGARGGLPTARANAQWCDGLPQHSPAPRAARTSFDGGGGSCSSCSDSGVRQAGGAREASPSWEERCRPLPPLASACVPLRPHIRRQQQSGQRKLLTPPYCPLHPLTTLWQVAEAAAAGGAEPARAVAAVEAHAQVRRAAPCAGATAERR